MEIFLKIFEFLFFGFLIINPIFWIIFLKKRKAIFYFLATTFSLLVFVWIAAWLSDMFEPGYRKINNPMAVSGAVIITFPYTIIIYVIYCLRNKNNKNSKTVTK